MRLKLLKQIKILKSHNLLTIHLSLRKFRKITFLSSDRVQSLSVTSKRETNIYFFLVFNEF